MKHLVVLLNTLPFVISPNQLCVPAKAGRLSGCTKRGPSFTHHIPAPGAPQALPCHIPLAISPIAMMPLVLVSLVFSAAPKS